MRRSTLLSGLSVGGLLSIADVSLAEAQSVADLTGPTVISQGERPLVYFLKNERLIAGGGSAQAEIEAHAMLPSTARTPLVTVTPLYLATSDADFRHRAKQISTVKVQFQQFKGVPLIDDHPLTWSNHYGLIPETLTNDVKSQTLAPDLVAPLTSIPLSDGRAFLTTPFYGIVDRNVTYTTLKRVFDRISSALGVLSTPPALAVIPLSLATTATIRTVEQIALGLVKVTSASQQEFYFSESPFPVVAKQGAPGAGAPGTLRLPAGTTNIALVRPKDLQNFESITKNRRCNFDSAGRIVIGSDQSPLTNVTYLTASFDVAEAS